MPGRATSSFSVRGMLPAATAVLGELQFVGSFGFVSLGDVVEVAANGTF